MIRFLLYLILFVLCWPIALVAGVIWLLLALIRLTLAFVAWMTKPPRDMRS